MPDSLPTTAPGRIAPSLADIAVALGAAGVPVFPCSWPSKAPAIPRSEGGRGWQDASTDPAEIRRMFSHPNADLIGMPTGGMSGLVVVDCDTKKGARGMDWLEAHSAALPSTRTHRTMNEGLHLVFQAPPGVVIPCSVGRLHHGVDIRGDGGYVIVPPSRGYVVADDIDPAPMPQWLIDAILALREAPREAPAAPAVSRPLTTEGGTRYGLAALRNECDAIRSAGHGYKHDTLNRAAYSIGGLVAAGELPEAEAFAELTSALHDMHARQPCDDFRKAQRTLREAFDDGKAKPRSAPPPLPPMPERGPVQIGGRKPAENPAEDPTTDPRAPGIGSSDVGGGSRPGFPATPWDASVLASLRRREWIYGHFLLARFLAVLGAPGGTGKTAYAVTVALAVATGLPLVEEPVHQAGPTWIYNLEDPIDEVQRRVWAACLAHGIDPATLEGRLYVDSGRDRPLVVAERAQDGSIIATPVVEPLVAELKARGIRLLVVDPFVKSHRLEENRNEQVDFAATLWNRVAGEAGCAILLLHHFRKGGQAGEADAFRGASALIDAARSAVALATMSEKEAGSLGVEPERRSFYIRADNAKLNVAPRPAEAVWLELQSVELPNGDRVQAVKRWEPPSPWDGLPARMVIRLVQQIADAPEDNLWSPRKEAKERWAGRILMDKAGKTEEQAVTILKSWEKNGLLVRKDFKNAVRKMVQGYLVDAATFADMKRDLGAGVSDDE